MWDLISPLELSNNLELRPPAGVVERRDTNHAEMYPEKDVTKGVSMSQGRRQAKNKELRTGNVSMKPYHSEKTINLKGE